MQFDVAIMNPPYHKELHLNILEKVLEHTKDIINISPFGWLQDMTTQFGIKKSILQRHESLAKTLIAFELVNRKDGNDSFSIGSFHDLAIQHYKRGATSDLYKTIWNDGIKLKSIFDKVIIPTANGTISSIANGNVTISNIHGHPGEKDEYDIISPIYSLLKEKNADVDDNVLEEFARNCNTKLMKYLNMLVRVGQHIMTEYIPYPSNANMELINSLLTAEEKEHIEKVMNLICGGEVKYGNVNK